MDYPCFHEIVACARQKVRRYGMATVAECVLAIPDSEAARRETALVETILSGQRDFRWLDHSTGWFWFSDTTRNRAVNRLRKMLAVANPLTIDEIHAGLARMGVPLAPDKTLVEFCRQVPGLAIEGDRVKADPAIEIHAVLNRTEQDIFRLLSEHDGCMSNSDLIDRSHVLGMKRPTLYQCVSHSPIVSRYKRSYYRLVGSLRHEEGALICGAS
ncbi:MAG TPA: hypothetical protein VHC72_19965 [Bryobacteraceae bacterium]|nr:hypothetical protein [Bryobacteraceae bacterium]